MRKFWVIFNYDQGRRHVAKAMCGTSERAVAFEIRNRFRGAEIKAIRALG